MKIMDTKILINDFEKRLAKVVETVDDGFYDTFEFTQTGNNFTHPWTWARLFDIFYEIDGVTALVNDQRRFKPDVVVCKNGKNGFNFSPSLYIDYESPNSCDARIVKKDVEKYILFGNPIPYIIITTLPKKESPDWKLLWTGKDGANKHLHGLNRNEKNQERDKIRKNPFDYWFSFYREKLSSCRKKHKDWIDQLDNIYFININSKETSFEIKPK